ncbi:Flp pilus assembly protein CpaB [Hydrogenophaga pseudoflava]|jgi:pilus assembly protein CpaB|uniref:Flp pilus assembly protein CpaB n=1 Tax=Hydrogenophaga pseudoflava TaxID=47421 RepID=UPI000823FC33|nr:Flp pilus assembly protein CpaB [Hydrogenophaga pseudoflava]
MQSKRAIFMLVLSLLAGAAAVVLAARWLGQQASGERTQVLVATRDLDLGQAISPEMLQPVAWPSGNVPAGSFTDPQLLDGRVVRNSIFKGEPVLEPKLAPEGTKAGLDSIIKPGHRAISVKVNEVVGVAGFLAPGSYVDLLVNIRDDRDTAISRVVLERIMVLAVAQEARRPDETKARVVNAVTLEVTPEQAEKIDLARNVGTLSLMLRNQVDTKDDVNTAGVRREDLFGDAKPAPAPVVAAAPVRRAAPRPAPRPVAAVAPAAPPAPTVEVIRGTQKSSASF